MMKILNILVLIFVLAACSSTEEQNSQNYDDESKPRRTKITDKYRQMRLRDRQKRKSRRSYSKPHKIKKYYLRKEDLSMELQQVMEFFCATRKRDSVLNNPEQCNQFIQTTLDKCKSRYRNHKGRAFKRCVKGKLSV